MKIIQQLLKRFNDARDPQMTPVDTRRRAVHRAVTPAPLLLMLEPRVIYDASVGAIAAHPHAHGADADTHAGAAAATNATVHAAPKTIAEHDVHPAKPVNGTATATPNSANSANSTKDSSSATQKADTQKPAQSGDVVASDAASHAVVFIDPSVPDYQSLIAGLPAGSRYVVLNANIDGFAQIAQYLQTHQGIESIHLISHGTDGEIQAGAAWLNSSNLSNYAGDLAAIGAAMAPGGDFLIYGCDVAEHADGQALVQQVAALTHLNVAASTDLTGSSAVGGDWTLEYQVGKVHTPVLLSAATEQAYDHLLGTTIENYNGATASTFDTGGNVSSFTLDNLIYTFKDANGNPLAFHSTVSTDSFLQALADEDGSSNALVLNTDPGSVPVGLASITITRVGNTPFNFQSIDLDIESNAGAQGLVTIVADNNSGDAATLETDNEFTAATVTLSASHASFADAHSITISGGDLIATLGHLVYADVGPSLTASSGSAAFTAGDNTASTPVPLDSHLTLADPSSATAQSATITIANVKTGDELLFTPNASTMGNISAAYSNGVLTLSSSGGSATIAQWQTALQSITFTNTQITPDATARTINFSITDSAGATTTATRTLTVTDTDQTPIVHTTGGSTSYVAGGASTTIDSGLSITDSDSTHQGSATVTVSNAGTGDTLNFTANATLYGNISGTYVGGTTPTLTLTGLATDAQWQAALDSVGFSSSVGTSGGARTVNFSINDGTKTSTVATKTINVSPVPIVTTDSGSAAFVSADNATSTPVAVDSGITIAENGGTGALASVTASITGNFQEGEDNLLYVNNPATMGDISGAYNASTGILTLTSSSHASLAQWQAALRSITYTDSAASPATPTRTISFAANDGSNSGPVATRQVTVTATDNSPIVTLSSGTTAYVAGSAAVSVDTGVNVTDRDPNPTLTQATVTIASGKQTGDTLVFVNDSFVTGSYNSTSGQLTLTANGSVSDAQWNTELDKIQFSTAANTTAGARTISYSVNDGTRPSNTATRTVNVTATPVVTTDAGSAAFVAGDNTASTPVAVDSGITVADGGSTTLVSATVQITGNFHAGEDLLLYTPSGATGDITGTYDTSTGLLTLTSASHATLAQWQSALRAIAFYDTAVTPSSATRTISFTVNDGSNISPVVTRTVTVQDTDQTPILTTSGGTTAFVEADNTTSTPVAIDTGVTVSDLDNGTFTSAHVAITGGFSAGEDVLSFSNTSIAQYGDISATYDASTGVLTLTSSGASTQAQWQAALRAVTYTDTAITPATTQRTVSFTVNDGTTDSNSGTETVSVSGTDQSPVLGASSGNFDYLPGDAAHSIDSGITLTDTDNATMASLTVRIGSGFQSGDQLSLNFNAATMSSNFNVTFDGAAGTLTITRTGTMTLANWQAIVDNVQFSSAPGVALGTRTVSIVTSDGTKDSNTLSYDVDVISSAPQLSTTSTGSATFVAGDNMPGTPVVVDGGLSVLDPLGNPIQSASISITGGLHSGEDVLVFTNDGLTMGDISGSYNALTGTLTLFSASGTATDGQWDAALHAVMYTDTAVTPIQATRSISFSISDGTQDSTGLTRNVTVSAVDQTPVVTASGGDTAYVEGDNAVTTVTVDSGIAVTDSDNTTLVSATVAIASGFHAGEDLLAFDSHGDTATFGNIAGSYDATTGELTLNSQNGTATLGQWQAALRAVTYTDTAATPDTTQRVISFTVNDGARDSAAAGKPIDLTATDQSPVLSASSGNADYLSGAAAHTIDSGITLTDSDSTTMASLTVQFTAGFHSGDQLSLNYDAATMGANFTTSFDAVAGTFTITRTGSMPLANWQAIADGVQFSATAGGPLGTRSLSVVTFDGVKDSNTLAYNVDVINSAPQLSTSSAGSTSFIAGDNVASKPVAVDGGLSVTDPLGNPITTATASITGNFHSGEDVLQYTNNGTTMGDITGSFNALTGVLTLHSASGTASNAQWDAALRSVTFTDTAVTPSTATRSISFSVTDGTQTSVALTRTVTVAAVDQTPVVTTSGGAASYVEGDNAVTTITVDRGITLTDRDNATLTSATVSITSGFHAGEDVLSFNNTSAAQFGNIAASYDASSGVMTLKSAGGTATVGQWQAALHAITYTDTAIVPAGAARTVSFIVSDGAKDSVAGTRVIDVTATVQTPLLAGGTGATPTFAAIGAGATPVVVDSGISIGDRDANAHLESALVSISGNFEPGKDVLAFNGSAATGNITASYDASTGVLTLSSAGSSATLAQWQAALASVTYADTSAETSGGSRTISFAVNTGGKSSAAITRSVNIAAEPVTPPPSSSPPAPGLQPTPPTPITLPSRSPFVGGMRSTVAITPAPAASAPDTIATFPMDLDGSISTPLIVLDLFADAPEIGAIPTIHTATFSTGDFGELGASNGSGTGGGTHWHGSLSDTSVSSMQPVAVPDATALPIDLPSQALEVDVAPNHAFTLSLPMMLNTEGAPLSAGAHIEVRLANGRALPRWLHFDAVHGALSGRVPANQAPLQISIVARDAAGHQVNRELTIDFGGQRGHAARTHAPAVPHAGLPVAKPSLAEQFSRAHATLHVARPTGSSHATSVAGLTLAPAPAVVTVDRDNA